MAVDDADRARMDKWLWAARFFKARSLAADAISGGQVRIKGERVKAARPVKLGEELAIRIGPYEYIVKVTGLSARRGSAADAALLYQETEASRTARESLAARLKAERSLLPAHKGRPTKRDRRRMDRFTG